jgi:predicted AAA+ superfamily ATPase
VIKGSRGVGKTTLILQAIKEHSDPKKSIWLSLDHILFTTVRVITVIDSLYEEGYRTFAFDEVHKYPDWSIEIKNIYDSYPDINMLVTASDALNIMQGMGDLSRRADVYHLKGLSFREYLSLDHDINLDIYSYTDLKSHHIEISETIVQDLDILKYFNSYLKMGYYPYFIESKKRYPEKVKQVINHVIEIDLPPIFAIDYKSIRQLKKLLALLARLVPYTPEITKLSRDVGIGRNRILQFLDYLNSAGLINLLNSARKTDSIMSKPDKIFMENTNIIYALGLGIAHAGTIREIYAMNALSTTEEVHTPLKGDFMINHTDIAEVGGKNKNFKQIYDMPNSYLLKDGIAVGGTDVMPLWCLGLLY